MPQTTKRPQFAQVRSWLNEIHREKTAAAKSAKAHAETGGYTGETTHPIKDVDDGLETAHTGARSSENEKDQKDRPMKGVVDETSETSKTQEDLNLNIGVQQGATGEQPSVEDDYKGKVKDPGTSSPMNADEVGEKYSSWIKKEATELSSLANDLLADIATGVGLSTGTSTPTQKTAASTKPNTTVVAQAGYELASMLGLDKQAADYASEQVIAETIKQAQLSAERVGSYLVYFAQESDRLQKAAAGEEELPPPVEGEGGGGGGDPAAALAAAGAGGGPGGPEGGGAPAPEGAGPPPEMGGGAGPGGPEGAGGGHEQALQELAMALMELGISPEELQQLAAGGGGMGGGMGGPGGPGGGMPPGAAGGMPPGPEAGGGAPPMMPPPGAGGGGPAEMGAKIASEVRRFQRSGRFKFSEAKTAAQQQQRNEMKNYLLELIKANR